MHNRIHFINDVTAPVGCTPIPLDLSGVGRRAPGQHNRLMTISENGFCERSSEKTSASSNQYFHPETCPSQLTAFTNPLIGHIIVPVTETECTNLS
jgi:hypothetical protein